MRKLALCGVLVLAGLLAGSGTARANGCQAWPTTAAFPTVNPSGWYTNTYWFDWFYPWYAYYNFSQGPYSGWVAGRGYAVYGYRAPAAPAAPAGGLPSEVVLFLPADSKLLISGTPVPGAGAIRAFPTPPLAPGQEYAYEIAAEVVQGGQVVRASKFVPVYAGQRVEVKFEAKDFAPASK